MAESPGSVKEGCSDISGLQIGQFGKDLISRESGGEEFEYVDDPDSHPTDARTPTALLGVDRDPTDFVCHEILPSNMSRVLPQVTVSIENS